MYSNVLCKKRGKKMSDRIIRKVFENKKNKQKIITIPQNSSIKAGDYVELFVIPEYEREVENSE